MVQTCCLIRKSSLKYRRRLQVAVNICCQTEAGSVAFLFPELLYPQEMPFAPGAHNTMHKVPDIDALKKGNRAKHLKLLPPFDLVRLLRN